MLHQPTIEKLLTMRLEPMVETWRSFEQDENAQQLSFEEKLSLLVDRLWTWGHNLALERGLVFAKLPSRYLSIKNWFACCRKAIVSNFSHNFRREP